MIPPYNVMSFDLAGPFSICYVKFLLPAMIEYVSSSAVTLVSEDYTGKKMTSAITNTP